MASQHNDSFLSYDNGSLSCDLSYDNSTKKNVDSISSKTTTNLNISSANDYHSPTGADDSSKYSSAFDEQDVVHHHESLTDYESLSCHNDPPILPHVDEDEHDISSSSSSTNSHRTHRSQEIENDLRVMPLHYQWRINFNISV